ncbi:VanW family protein [Cohnella cellulosilytica]|uniref:VanW family protein n=1 Tax=Cohnella cellulosilytica TaxID=986710 RepID=A0ABW2F611_9BACL
MAWKWIVGALLLAHAAILPERLAIMSDGEEIAVVRRTDYEFPLPGLPIVNDVKFLELTGRIEKLVHRPPLNAALDASGAIVPEKPGYRLDRAAWEKSFYRFMVEGTPSSLQPPLKTIYPRVDSELLASLKEKMIGHYTTYYNSNNKSRSHNIDLAAKALNNRYVFPGESFSFNETLGERTAGKGYKRAKIIVRGEVAEGIGGGICQVSSTLFNAVDRAGMTIVRRYSHSRNVPYVPPGRDATVSWYGPDFVFSNPYDHPVLIRSFAGGGQTTVLIYSADEIHNRPREVPSATKKLPKEVPAGRDVHLFVP